MSRKLVVMCAFVACAMVFSAREASAQGVAGAASAAAFHPVYPTDAANITNYGYEIFNTDTSTAHNVVGYLARDAGSYTNYQATVIANNNGGSLSCDIEVLNTSTGAFFFSSLITTTATGFVSFPINLSLTAGSPIALFSLFCSLPPKNAYGPSYLFGVSQFTD
jgi:hypothetical protein